MSKSPESWGPIEDVLIIIKKIYEENLAEDLCSYLEFLCEKEKKWVEDSYSDGYFVYSLVKEYTDRAIEEKNTEMTAALLAYKDSHYDSAFMAEAESSRQEMEWGLKKKPAVYYLKGASVFFGSYMQSDAEDAEPEPIEWKVLKQENNRALLLSRYGLIDQPFHEAFKSVTWEDCTLRKWLQEVFLEEAFSEEEKECIEAVTNPNHSNRVYHTCGGNDTIDRVFLLSIEEAETYFADNAARLKTVTPWAKKNGAWSVDEDVCWWWLRSPGRYDDQAATVDPHGNVGATGVGIHVSGIHVHFSTGCVCPAIWIRI